MIQPDMATMLAYIATDARIEAEDLQRLLSVVVRKSFNRISVDSDTSTSDTAAILANGASDKKISFPQSAADALSTMAWPIAAEALAILKLDDDSTEFLSSLLETCVALSKLIAADGEGATKLIELQIRGARDPAQALRIGRSVINSPLVKTAIYGADPNWGRLLMAIGKTSDPDLRLDLLRIYFGSYELEEGSQAEELKVLSNYLRNSDITIRIQLGLGEAAETLWGCDLTEDYVRLNSMYTT